MLLPTQTTPLLLPSEYTLLLHQIVTDPDDADYEASLEGYLNLLIEASAAVQRYCGRRFDERRETRRFRPVTIQRNGHMLDARTLQMDDDLKTIITFATDVPASATEAADGTVLAGGDYVPIKGRTIFGETVITQLKRAGGFSYDPDNPENVWIDGIWGRGGRWVKVGAKLSEDAAADDETLIVDAIGRLEPGMVLRLGDTHDYAYCLDLTIPSGTDPITITVDRGYNGSVAEAHSTNDAVYFWLAMETPRALVRRLVTWAVEQVKSPTTGTVTIGDFSYPADTSGLPKDLFIIIKSSGLMRMGDVKHA